MANAYARGFECTDAVQPGNPGGAASGASKPGLTSVTAVAAAAGAALACGMSASAEVVQHAKASVATAPRMRIAASAAIGDRALAGGRHDPRVLAEHATRVARRRRLPRGAAARDLAVFDVELQETLVGVDRDRVAVVHQRDEAARLRFRRDVPDHHPPRAAGEAAVGDEADRLAEALPDQRRRRREHLLHARSAARPLVADDDHVAS